MTELPILPAFPEKNVAITMQSSDYFAPYTSVTIKSIMDHTSADHNYDILVTTKDMTEENAAILCGMADAYENISIRVTNVKEIYDQLIQVEDKRFGGETVTRIFLMELLPDYDKVLNLDSDMIVCADVAELYNTDISDYYMGAVQDLQSYISYYKFENSYFNRDFVLNNLGLDNIDKYYNGGMFLLNLSKIRKNFTAKYIAEYVTNQQFRFFEQDAFSSLFRDAVLGIDWSWNWQCDADNYFQHNIESIYDRSGYQLKYTHAKRYPRIIHFLSKIKPWDNAKTAYADIWWHHAATTPFYSKILNKHYPRQNSNITKKVLFICETPYHLFNVIQIKYQMYRHVYSDLILTSSSDFSPYISELRNLDLFNNIYQVGYNVSTDIATLRLSAPNKKLVQFPEEYEHCIEFSTSYTDYFMPVLSSPYQKIIYYALVKKGCTPQVHIFEDGAITYIEEVEASIAKDTLDHKAIHKKKRFINNICEILVRKPALYTAKNVGISINILPELNSADRSIQEIFKSIWKTIELPQEKYIFFNESFVSEGLASNDIDILSRIAEVVGKENIIIKPHPRATAEKEAYIRHGFKIYDTNIPWEVAVLNPELEKKVLLSISSNSVITPWTITGKTPFVVYLWNVMTLSSRHHVRESGYKSFISTAEMNINLFTKRFYCPRSINELDEIMNYIEGEL